MTDLDKIYGKERIIDTPVSESAYTGAAVGASLSEQDVDSCSKNRTSCFMQLIQLLIRPQSGAI